MNANTAGEALTVEQFDRSRRLASKLAGIELFQRHREFIGLRLRRLGFDEVARVDALLDAVEDDDAQAKQQFISLVATRFPGFFRHPWHFDIAAEHALWAAHRRGAARLWSAAAATGEEPYSLAMALIEVFGNQTPPATILATDISEAALAVANAGEYSDEALGAVEPGRRNRFFTESTVTGRWKVASSARQLVEFGSLNLADAVWPVAGLFDVIFCRNVVMYLARSCRDSALERLASLLSPDGVVILDPTEHIGSAGHLFTCGTGGVYSLRRNSAPTAGVAGGRRL
jgi:chemotaxis protein methyltransferase CheR